MATQNTKKAVTKKAVTKKAVTKKAVTKKAVTKKAVTKKAVTKKAVTKKAVTKKAVTKKAVTKKAVTKAIPPLKVTKSTQSMEIEKTQKKLNSELELKDRLKDLHISNNKGLIRFLKDRKVSAADAVNYMKYERELQGLQVELVKLQLSVQKNERRVALLFEGRDAAGKGGSIRRFTQHLNPRHMRVVALPKPTDMEKGQWYFQRYVNQLPNPGEICFFDRSWYNRAVVEPVNGFCSEAQYQTFLRQVPEFEHMLYEDGVEVVKFWFSISKNEQKKRFDARAESPLKQWKLSPVDGKAQDLWDRYTKYKDAMFSHTHTSFSPWVIVRGNSKKKARLESIRYVLSRLSYEGKDKSMVSLERDPNIVSRYHRHHRQEDR